MIQRYRHNHHRRQRSYNLKSGLLLAEIESVVSRLKTLVRMWFQK